MTAMSDSIPDTGPSRGTGGSIGVYFKNITVLPASDSPTSDSSAGS